MKYSVIVPVYNGEKTIVQCLESLVDQNYPKDKYEIVVVNDGSKDRTEKIVKRFPVKLINLKENVGRVSARVVGAKKAKYDQLAFINANCFADKNWLANGEKANYLPLVGSVITNPKRSNADRFFYLMREKFYQQVEESTYIESHNFYKIGKAITNFFCSKKLFLKCSPKRIGKYVSDDNDVFLNILEYTKILYQPNLVVYHFERTRVKQIYKQWVMRGSCFADFYLLHTKKYLLLFLVLMSIFSIAILAGLFKPPLFLYELLVALFLMIIASIYFCEKLSDFKIIFPYLVIVVFAESLGIIRRMKVVFAAYFLVLFSVSVYILGLRVL